MHLCTGKVTHCTVSKQPDDMHQIHLHLHMLDIASTDRHPLMSPLSRLSYDTQVLHNLSNLDWCLYDHPIPEPEVDCLPPSCPAPPYLCTSRGRPATVL